MNAAERMSNILSHVSGINDECDATPILIATRKEWQLVLAEIEGLRNEVAHLTFCLQSRDQFISDRGLWMDYVKTLPQSNAGGPGYAWSEKPTTVEQ